MCRNNRRQRRGTRGGPIRQLLESRRTQTAAPALRHHNNAEETSVPGSQPQQYVSTSQQQYGTIYTEASPPGIRSPQDKEELSPPPYEKHPALREPSDGLAEQFERTMRLRRTYSGSSSGSVLSGGGSRDRYYERGTNGKVYVLGVPVSGELAEKLMRKEDEFMAKLQKKVEKRAARQARKEKRYAC